MDPSTAFYNDEKRRQKERREIAKWEKEGARPKGPGYLYYLVFLICVVYISDEVATQIGTQMQSVVAQALFAPIFGAEMAVARMSAFGTLTMAGSILAFLYKPLSDRYGRKLFLVLNTLGMGAGLLLISISTNIPVYLLGAFVIAFFIPHDMQQVYILETMPPKQRATWYAIIKAIATLGMMLIPVLRNLVMGADITKWRNVYLIPGLMAVAAAVFCALLVRETDPFIKSRLDYLRMSDEQRAAIKQDKKAEHAQGGLISAIKFAFRHKQIRWLLIGHGFIMWGMVMTMYYETTMTHGYAAQFLASGATLEAATSNAVPFVTQALFFFPFGSAFFQFFQGFLSDKWGRKPTVIIMSVCAITTFFLFFFGANRGWSPVLIGLLCGSAVGSYWAAGDICGIMCSESTPTNLRVSVMAVQPLVSGIFASVALFTPMILLNILGDAYAGILSIAIAIPGLATGLIMIMLKVRETKNVNMEEVTGNE